MKSMISSEIRSHLLNIAKLSTKEGATYPPVKIIPANERLRILVTGGSGFVGE
jgi:hypothetical protein